MKRIGIIGEHFNNDACALSLLLTPQYQGQIKFIPVLKSLKGGYNSAVKISRMLPTEMLKNNLDAVICTHDLDNYAKQASVEAWFKAINDSIRDKGVLFLLVMELEALILADIESFNKIYCTTIKYSKNPKNEPDPKKYLMDKTFKAKRKYDENHSEEIFKQLRFDIVYKKHKGEQSFQAFIDAFNSNFDIHTTI